MNEFEWDCLQKKNIAKNASRMKSSRRRCTLPSDNLTRRQWEKKNGPVIIIQEGKKKDEVDTVQASTDSTGVAENT